MAITDMERMEAELRLSYEWFHGDMDDAIASCLPLGANDRLLVGTLVQTMAYLDFEGRRTLEHLDLAEGREPPSANRTPRDTELLRMIVERLRSTSLRLSRIDDGVEMLRFVESCAVHRHRFAHWMTKRSPVSDCLISLTKNNRQVERQRGSPLRAYEVRTAVMHAQDLQVIVEQLASAADDYGRLNGVWLDELEIQGLLPPLRNFDREAEADD